MMIPRRENGTKFFDFRFSFRKRDMHSELFFGGAGIWAFLEREVLFVWEDTMTMQGFLCDAMNSTLMLFGRDEAMTWFLNLV